MDPDDIRFVLGRVRTVLELLGRAGYHVLADGELEDYLRNDTSVRPLSQESKSRIFDDARADLLEAEGTEDVEDIVGDLVLVLESISTSQKLDLIEYIEEPISDWVHEVQWAIRRGEIESIEDLRSHDTAGQNQLTRLFEIEELDVREDQFTCRIRLNQKIDPEERTWEFDQEVSPASINLRD